MASELIPSDYPAFIADLKERIRAAQVRASLAINRELVLLYWQIGRDLLNHSIGLKNGYQQSTTLKCNAETADLLYVLLLQGGRHKVYFCMNDSKNAVNDRGCSSLSGGRIACALNIFCGRWAGGKTPGALEYQDCCLSANNS